MEALNYFSNLIDATLVIGSRGQKDYLPNANNGSLDAIHIDKQSWAGSGQGSAESLKHISLIVTHSESTKR